MPEESNRLKLIDMHGYDVGFVHDDEARGLIQIGHGRFFHTRNGSVSKIRGVRLIVPLMVVNGTDSPERSLCATNYCGSRFIFRAKISTEATNFYSFRFKKLHPFESPDAALLRITGQIPECPPDIRAVRDFSDTWDGSNLSLVRSADGRVPNTSQSRPLIADLAA